MTGTILAAETGKLFGSFSIWMAAVFYLCFLVVSGVCLFLHTKVATLNGKTVYEYSTFLPISVVCLFIGAYGLAHTFV